jgi:hypothetical protein
MQKYPNWYQANPNIFMVIWLFSIMWFPKNIKFQIPYPLDIEKKKQINIGSNPSKLGTFPTLEYIAYMC